MKKCAGVKSFDLCLTRLDPNLQYTAETYVVSRQYANMQFIKGALIIGLKTIQ